MRLIDADALAARILTDAPDFLDGGSSITKAFILAMIRTRSATPTVEDAVRVVRCMDCKYYGYHDMTNEDGCCYCLKRHEYPYPDWYCADGEKEEIECTTTTA